MYYDIFPHYDIGDLVRVSGLRSEDDILDLVHSFQVKRAFRRPAHMERQPFCAAKSSLSFLILTLRSRAPFLTSLKYSVIRDRGVGLD